jgi:polyadenylate-binding protein
LGEPYINGSKKGACIQFLDVEDAKSVLEEFNG